MIKKRIVIGLFVLSSLAVFGQKKSELPFDINDFNQKARTAEWLYVYDAIAWWTSDSVMTEKEEDLQRLGSEWFCFQTENDNWHAVYGKYENDKMNVIFHYLVDTTYKVSKTFEQIDNEFLNLHARALITANNQLSAIKDSIPLRFNQYIKQNDDKTFSVWIFPAFQPNGYAVYGGEFIYKIDPTGTQILEDNSYFQGKFLAFQVGEPREVWMNYTELEKPTIGNVFFIWYYKRYFTYIKLENKNYVTTTFNNGDGDYSWIHIEKIEKATAKEKKKKRK